MASLLPFRKVSSATNISRQISVNQVLQESNTVCFANCSNVTGNIRFIITNGSRIDDITITQQCNSNALCTVKNSYEAVALQQLDNYQFGSARGVGMCLLKVSCVDKATNINQQYLYNSTTQMFNTACIAQAENVVSNVTVYVSDNSSVGGFTIEQTGNATADCTLDNTARAYTAQSSTSEQIAKSGNGLLLLFIILLITAIIVGIVYYFNTAVKKAELEAKVKQIEAINASGNEAAIIASVPGALETQKQLVGLEILKQQYNVS